MAVLLPLLFFSKGIFVGGWWDSQALMSQLGLPTAFIRTSRENKKHKVPAAYIANATKRQKAGVASKTKRQNRKKLLPAHKFDSEPT